MISVGLLFMFIAGVAFLGFIIGALFNRIRVTKILPLMLIGLLIGPLLHLVNVSANSLLADLVPIVSALAISFILFDVGMNINIFRLRKVIKRATAFMLAIAVSTGIIIAAAAYFSFGWSLIEALMFGFALSGPSAVIVPTLMKSLGVNAELNDTLIYESVATDALSLVVPILLLQLMLATNVTVPGAVSLFITSVFGAILLGAVLAAIWLYLLKNFKNYSKDYRWMLTLTMVLATYGIAAQMGVNTAIAIFTFGIIFANLGMATFKVETPSDITKTSAQNNDLLAFIMRYLHLGNDIRYIKNFQKEVEFFTSTFFFVYIGLLFSASNLTIVMIGISILIVLMMILVRFLFLPMLGDYLPRNPSEKKITEKMISFNISRGLSPAVVATLPLAAGIIIPNFLNQIFLVILFSNVASTLGVFIFYRSRSAAPSKKNNSAVA